MTLAWLTKVPAVFLLPACMLIALFWCRPRTLHAWLKFIERLLYICRNFRRHLCRTLGSNVDRFSGRVTMDCNRDECLPTGARNHKLFLGTRD